MGSPPPHDECVIAVQIFTVELAAGAELSAIGAALTVELCGHWEHPPPCRWPHHTESRMWQPSSDRVGQARTVFAARWDHIPELRQRMIARVRTGRLDHDGEVSRWRLLDSSADEPTASERDLGERLFSASPSISDDEPPAPS